MAFSLHLVAGIPGTRVQKSLEKFTKYARDRGSTPVVWVSVEEELRKIAAPHVEKHWRMKGSPLGLLLLPNPFLRKLWADALDAAWKKVEESIASSNVILTLHLCYFLHMTREYFVPVDFELFKEKVVGRAASIITLIDDIYDCHRHLFAIRGRFDPPKDSEQAVLDLLKILDWRSKEILVAKSLADTCHLPHFVFGVKHPIETFYDLLYSPTKKKVYLSHPISEPRRTHQRGNVDDANAIINHMDKMVERLRSRHVVFEPTAIDELRFISSGDLPTGNLALRWPFKRDTRDLLYVPPANSNNDSAFPIGWDADTRAAIPPSSLLRELHEAIMFQITARDHTLVEQSELLGCIRPLFQGNASGGVREGVRSLPCA